MKLTEFVLARIAEDDAAARGAGADAMTGFRWKHYPKDAYDEVQALTLAHSRRMLAECEAKRRIVELHEPVDYTGLGMESPNACSLCGVDLGMSDWDWERDSFPCDTLKALAAVHADHPDYREEWRP